jgi:glycosyltransferase involved in cell wall biosynthesis
MHIAILMATYNGSNYIEEQLHSFDRQSHSDWSLWLSDDGSTDSTKSLINEFFDIRGETSVQIFDGPKKGFSANFLSLVCNLSLKADAYAYSDQDDIWLNDKLERAENFLSSVPGNIPALYCSRTQYVDLNNISIGLSIAYSRPAIFKNALVQNIASGNTMVFNDAARKLLLQAGPNVDIELHDWWTYMLVTGAGGRVFFDHHPSVRYRQHPNNLWGMNTSFKAQVMRIKKLFGGRFQGWNERHVAALNENIELLTSANQKIFQQFSLARKLSLLPRLIALKKSGVYRQTPINNFGFFLAALAGKV